MKQMGRQWQPKEASETEHCHQPNNMRALSDNNHMISSATNKQLGRLTLQTQVCSGCMMNQYITTTTYMRSLIYGHHQYDYHCLYMCV